MHFKELQYFNFLIIFYVSVIVQRGYGCISVIFFIQILYT